MFQFFKIPWSSGFLFKCYKTNCFIKLSPLGKALFHLLGCQVHKDRKVNCLLILPGTNRYIIHGLNLSGPTPLEYP